MRGAVILTIGSELVSGDVVDTNGAWLARQLEQLGVRVRLMAAVPDDVETIASFLRDEASRADFLLVTGGLGGTPDDVTREAVAAAFDVPQRELPEVADALRARFTRNPDYAARWALLPEGSRPLENPLGGAPGFAIRNVYVFPGLPSEMEAMFGVVAGELRRAAPIASWRRSYRTRESEIAAVLAEAERLHPAVGVGSYPTFRADGAAVEIVLKCDDPAALDAARAWLERKLAETV
ncbi:MAG: molybdopterin-binding protein [Actinomycetota bacterium]|nr:molybdopterin-binding protein [Actinomycetota bacterium]